MTLDTQKVGPPIYLKVDAGQVLNVTAGSVRQNGLSVPTTVLTNANDPNRDASNRPYVGPNEAFVIPTVALIPNADYTVSLAGSINGASFSRNFTMRTGS